MMRIVTGEEEENAMTATMRAERFYADTKRIVVEDVPIPSPDRARCWSGWRSAASAIRTSA